ncbi:uncharacterized protein LOC129293604 [Prosopis cineraria]|uniref:uncharacterized protein LOC129293604 n=1 Tax=Prosopis cineraria TaxID=364024 RepID=UPI00241042B4|nr:uncharacterized protein LOC129293604 [Prosopis cineraria]
MSGLTDRWTNEVSKLKEKDEAISAPHGSAHVEADQQQQKQKMGSIGLAVAVGEFSHLNKPRLLFSEDAVSLLVSCFSP